VAILPRADVACRLEWKPAERAGRSTGPDDLDGPARERASGLRADAHPQHRRAVLRDILCQRFERLFAFLLGLDDDTLVIVIPGERDRPNPEVLRQRKIKRTVVDSRLRGRRRRSAGAPRYLVQ
jgi:hypothetical protein